MRMHPPLVSCAHFRIAGACGHLHRRLSLCPTAPCLGRKGHIMKLKIRYDEAYQLLDLDEQATEQLWVSLDLDGGEALSQEEREKRIQEAFDAKYNRPEYNSWRKLNRHRGESKAKPGKDETEDDVDTSEPLMSEVADDRIFRQDELAREKREQYEAICEWVRSVLADKPRWAAAFIAVHMDLVPTKDYAASLGVDPTTVTHWLRRAEKKLRENYKNRQF